MTMRRLNLILLFAILSVGFTQAQATLDELKAMQSEKLAAADALAGEAADLQKQIDALPGWKSGAVGIIGADFSGNDSWYAINNPFSSSTGLGLSATAFANLNQEKLFWNNLFSLNLKQVNTNLGTATSTDGEEVKAITDALDISSLGGYKLSPKWALSAEGRYSSTLLNFNNPGKLTISAGATWLPIPNAVVIFHPLAYELNFPGDFVSAPGCKIGATYSAAIIPGVAWSTNLSAFIPYSAGEGTVNRFPTSNNLAFNDPKAEFDTDAAAVSSETLDYSTGDLTNWTWLNTFSTNIFKGIGVGLNVGLRQDKQIVNQSKYQRGEDNAVTFDNPLQLYYSLGLSYTL